MSSKGNTITGDPYAADFVLNNISLAEEGYYEISVWILMFCRLICSNDKYSIRINVKDSINNDLLNDECFYKQSEYQILKWKQTKYLFKYEDGQIKVRNELSNIYFRS